MAETLTTPPPVQAPTTPAAPLGRSQQIDSIIKALPPDQAADIRSKFDQTLGHAELEQYVRGLQLPSESKSRLWDAYWDTEAPKVRPTPLTPKEPSTWDIIKGAPAAALQLGKELQAPNLAKATPLVPVPAPPVTGTNRQTVTPNTPATPTDLTNPELRLPAPAAPPKPLSIAGTHGNALVMSDGSQTTQNPNNLRIYHDSGYPELTQTDLLKLQRGESLTPTGQAEPGTIKNLYNRPILKNPDGSISTTRSMSFDEGGKEVVVPTVVDGKLLSDKEAIDRYHKTGEHLGKFTNVPDAEAFAQNLHESQAQRLGLPIDEDHDRNRQVSPFRDTSENETPEALQARVAGLERGAIASTGGMKPEEPKPWTALAQDLYRRTVRGGESMLSGATLGVAQAATGTIHIPILDKNFKVIPGTEEKLEQLGMAAPADKWQAATNVVSSLIGASAPWARISRLLAPLYGTAETGIAANILSRLENTLGTAFIVGAVEPKEDTGEKNPQVGFHETRLEHIATTMGAAAIFHTIAETAGGIGTAAKIKAINDLKAEVSEVLYGRRPDTFDPESAKKMAGDLVDQAVAEQGGVENVSRKSIKDKAARVKGASKEPLAVPGQAQVEAPAGGPGRPAGETGGPAPFEEPGTVEGPGFTAKPGAPAEAGAQPPLPGPGEEVPFPPGAPKPGEPPAAATISGGKTSTVIPAADVETVQGPNRQEIHPDAIPENKNLPKGMETPDGDVNHGSSSVGLSEEGKKDAAKLAAATDLPKKIYTSDAQRAVETAQVVQGAHPDIQVVPERGLQAWALGGLEGQPMKDVLPKINALAQDMPDAAPSGRGPISTRDGQSFHQWEDQLGPTVQRIMDEFEKNPTESVGILSHSRVFQWIHAWLEGGMPEDYRIDPSKLLRAYADTGGREYLYKDKDGWVLDDKKPPNGQASIQLIRHAHERQANVPAGAVPPPPAEAPQPPALKPKKQFVIAGKDVAGTYQGKVVTADGTVHERHPNYLKTMKAFGYPELTDDQFQSMGGKMPETKPVSAPEAPKPLPPVAGPPVAAPRGSYSVRQTPDGKFEVVRPNGAPLPRTPFTDQASAQGVADQMQKEYETMAGGLPPAAPPAAGPAPVPGPKPAPAPKPAPKPKPTGKAKSDAEIVKEALSETPKTGAIDDLMKDLALGPESAINPKKISDFVSEMKRSSNLALKGHAMPDELQRMVDRAENLADEIDQRYESGKTGGIDKLEGELDDLIDRIDSEMSQSEVENVLYPEDAEAGTEEDLARQYDELVRGLYPKDEVVERIKDILDKARFGTGHTGPRELNLGSDDELLAAAKDAYDRANSIRERLKPPKPNEVARVKQWLADRQNMISEMKTGEGKAAAGLDPRIVKTLGGNLYNGDLGVVAVREMLQNALDSLRGLDNPESRGVTIEVDTNRRTIYMADNGSGMTPEVAQKELMDIGGSKKAEGSSGGFGIAKVAIFANADEIDIHTVAEDPKTGKRFVTTLYGKGADWVDPELGLDVETHPADEEITGTNIRIKLSPDVTMGQFYMGRFAGDMMKSTSLLPYRVSFKLNGLFIEPSSVRLQKLAQVETPGSSADIHLGDGKEKVGDYGAVTYSILNNGLYQFNNSISVPKHLSGTMLPGPLVVNIHPKAGPEEAGYPFAPDRERIRDHDLTEKIREWLSDNFVLRALEGEKAAYVDRILNAPVIPGPNSLPIVDTSGNLPPDQVEALSKRPYVQRLSDQIMSSMDTLLGAINRGRMDGELDPAAIGIGLGTKYLGINIHGKMLDWDHNLILVNPYTIMDEVLSAIQFRHIAPTEGPAMVAARIVSTLVHELSHQAVRDHDEKFAGELSRNIDLTLLDSAHVQAELQAVLEHNGGEAYSGLYDDLTNLRPQWAGENIFGKISSSVATGGDEQAGAEDVAGEGAVGGRGRGEGLPSGGPGAQPEVAGGAGPERSDADITQLDPGTRAKLLKLGAYLYQTSPDWPAWSHAMSAAGDWVAPYLPTAYALIDDVAAATGKKPVSAPPPPEKPAQEPTAGPPDRGPPPVPAPRGESDVNAKPTTGVGNGEGPAGEPTGGAGGGPPAEGPRGEGGPGEPGVGSGEGVSPGRPSKPGAPRRPQQQQPRPATGERFTLVGKEPIDLTPQQRREINAKAIAIAGAKNQGDPLTPEEQDILRQYTGQGGLGTADEGVLFQHYTSYKVVQWQWDKLAAMGYPLEGASMLEPAAGVGNYLGFAPAGVRMTAVEIDPIAAKITQLLYPDATVHNKPFENFNSRQKFDIVMSNVPFSASRGELRYAKDAQEYKDIDTLHDFFFVKGLDVAKPNGLVFFLTSTGTMDKAGDEIRKLINEKAEFLGAYRTPAGEFKKNTQYGGSVDAILLRKRTPEEIEAFKALKEGKIATVEDLAKMGFTRPFGYNKDWVESTTTDKFSKPDQPPARISKYYIENPGQMWGQPEAGYGVRQVTRMGVRPTKPIEDFIGTSLGDHIQWKPEETVAAPNAEIETEKPVGKAPEGVRHGTLIVRPKTNDLAFAHSDGNIYPAFPKGLPEKTQGRLLAAVNMMDMADRLYGALRQNDDATANKIRPQLKAAITNYRSQYGDKTGKKLGKPPGYDPFLWRFLNGGTESMVLSFEDPRRWLLAGLTDDEGKFADIFDRNTIYRQPVVARAYNDKDLADVAKFVYEQTGEFAASRPEIEAKYNGEPADIDKDLVGKPGFSIESLSADGKPTINIDDEYMYGPIWPKIDQTEAMLQQATDPQIVSQLKHQLSGLHAALPEQATIQNLPVDPFASYMDQGTVIQWLRSFGMNGIQEYVPENNRTMWEIGGAGRLKLNVITDPKTNQMADHEFTAEDIQGFLNHKRLTKWIDTGETDYRGNPKRKEIFDLAKQRIIDQVGNHFKDWFSQNPKLTEHLVPTYNRMYRSYRHRSPSSQEVQVNGMSGTFKGKPLKIGNHQWEVANQMLHMRSGINGQGVGSGKTMAMIMLGQLAKQRGLIRKPIYVVPAKVIKNWGYEIMQMFPNAFILDTGGMNSKNRNKTLHRVASSDADFVLSTYEGMKEIPLRSAEEYIQEDLRELSERLHAVSQKNDKKTESMIQEQIRKYSEKLAKIQDMKKTNAIFFEDTGIDSIIVDEGHNYKNAPVQYMDMSDWLHAGSYSDRAADMGYKTRYIHERKGGRPGQNVWMATATPTPNNPIEIYSMMKYIAPDEWKQRGIHNAGDFVEQFGIVGQVEEPSTTGVPKIRTVFLGYKNLNDLRSIFRRYIDMRPTSAFALNRPTPAYTEHLLNPSPAVIYEAARVAELDEWVTKHFADAAAHGWNHLSVLTLARKLAGDLAIYNPTKYANSLGREGSKLNEIIRQVKDSEQGDNTQLIFMDIYRAVAHVEEGSKEEKLIQAWLAKKGEGELHGVDVDDDAAALVNDLEASSTAASDTKDSSDKATPGKIKTYELVNVHKSIKEALMAAGIPEDQIAIINQATNNSAAKKFKVQQLNAEGKVRFLIGTTSSMGEGMNLQANTTDIHHYDVPWTPAALEQREGRGVRQGNKQESVRIHRYVGKGTSDAKMYAMLARKAQWNENLWFGDADQVMDFDQDHRNYADISAEAQIDTSTLEYWQVSRRITTNTEKLAELETDVVAEDRRMLKQVQDEIASREQKIEQYTADIKAGRGNADYTARLIEQHRSAIANLRQEEQTRAETVAKAEKAINEARKAIEADKAKLKELIPVMKEKGMPVLPEHEAMATEPTPSPDQPPVPGPNAMGSPSPVPAPPEQRETTLSIPTRDGKGQTVKVYPVVPGLAVTPELEGEGFEILHTVSGNRIAKAPSIGSGVLLAKRLAKLGDWNRSAEALQADPAIVDGVRKELGQKGAVNFWQKRPPPSIQPNLIPSPDPEMRKLIDVPAGQRNVWQEIKDIPGQVYRFMTVARYNENLRDWPGFSEEVRRAQELVRDASAQTQKEMEKVVKGLDRSGYDAFRSIVFWEDMYETAAREGEDRVPLPGKDQLNRIDAEIARLNSIATPAVRDAVDRFHGWMEDVWNELARRGKVDPDEGRIKYFPNQIIRGIGDAIDRLPGLPTRMQNPRRLYLRNRKGHLVPHDSDWIRVMEQYGTRVYLHNMIDDFISRTADGHDFNQWLDDTQRQQLVGNRTGQAKIGRSYVLDTSTLTVKQKDEILTASRGGPGYTGELPDNIVLKGFQFNPGNVIYPVRAINDEVIWDAVKAGMDELSIDVNAFRNAALSSPVPPQLETDTGEELTRPALALGGKNKIYLLPAPIADKLEHFRENNLENPFTELARAATRAWKGTVINSSGLTYYTHITIGNEIAAYAEDLGSLMKQPAALDALRSKMTPPQYQQVMQLAEDFRIWNSVFYAGSQPRAVNAPAFREFRNPNWRDNPIGDLVREWQRAGQIVQSFPKFAKLMADLERVSNGQPVVVKGISLGGLDPKSMLALGKVARESIHPDYGAVSPRMDLFYSVTFPFSVFHVKIIGPWMRRMAHTGKFFPGDEFLLKMVLGLFISTFVWNHLLYPEIEKKLADWQRNMMHLNTPFHDENGRPVILAMETPTDIVKQWGGLHTLESNLDRVLDGKSTLEDAARQQLEDMFGHQPHGGPLPTAPAAMLYQLLNPMMKTYIDLQANKDSFTGQDIVSKSEPNLWGDPSKDNPQTDIGKRLQREYVAKKLISPYMQLMRAEQMDSPDSPVWNWLTSNGPFAWKRALGIRSVDPNGPDVKDWYNDRNWNQSLYDVKMYKVADAFVMWESGQISLDQRDAMIEPLLEQPGPNPTGPHPFSAQAGSEPSDIQRMREKPQYQIRVVEGLMHKTTDPEQKKAYLNELDALEYQIHRNSFKATPDRIRGFIGQPPVPAPVTH